VDSLVEFIFVVFMVVVMYGVLTLGSYFIDYVRVRIFMWKFKRYLRDR
jgi:hypothetical protein